MKKIQIRLLSDSIFGRGDGVQGLVDDEIDYDLSTGLPYIKGRTIKGLIVEECANILHSTSLWGAAEALDPLKVSAEKLFGSPGSGLSEEGCLHFGEAHLADSIVTSITRSLQSTECSLTAAEVLEAITGVRRRSAINELTEAPKEETLRATRVLMRETVFYAGLVETQPISQKEWELLAACVASLRRGGKNRNRGQGRSTCKLLDDNGNDQTLAWSNQFLDSIKERSQ